MISVETLLDAINTRMDIDGNILSMDVKTDNENTPIEITIRSTQFISPTEEQLIEVVINENGYTKRVIEKLLDN